MEKLKKALVSTVTFLVIITVSVVVRLAVRGMLSEPATGALDMSVAANRINTMAPMMVDEVTELMSKTTVVTVDRRDPLARSRLHQADWTLADELKVTRCRLAKNGRAVLAATNNDD